MNASPIYRKIIFDICESIDSKKLAIGQQISSLNEVCKTYGVSRDTAFKAYQELKTRGIIASFSGKGYYIASDKTQFNRKIFLLFDELTSYKSVLYNSIIYNLNNSIPVEIFFHHFHPQVFRSLITENIGKYTDYVIMPIYEKESFSILEGIDKTANLYLLDQGLDYFNNSYPFVGQEFKNDLYKALKDISKSLSQYSTLFMQIDEPKNTTESKIIGQIKEGFKIFCNEFGFQSFIDKKIKRIEKDWCYVIHSDIELVSFLKTLNDLQLIPGTDLGLISFNETPLKEVVNKGISTLSTDFEKMGLLIADLVVNKKSDRIINSFKLIERSSFSLKNN